MKVIRHAKVSKIVKLTGVGRKQIYKDIEAAKFPAYRIGRDYQVDEEAAIKYYNSLLEPAPVVIMPVKKRDAPRMSYEEFRGRYFGG